MENDGTLIYTVLVEYSTLTGQPTGRTKPNIPSDPDYIAPSVDTDACPLGGPEPVTMQITTETYYGFDVTIKLIFGAIIEEEEVIGDEVDAFKVEHWDVPIRIYDAIQIDIADSPTDPFWFAVTYNGGTVLRFPVVGSGSIYIPGPFAAITKIRFEPWGDFNDDYVDDFLI